MGSHGGTASITMQNKSERQLYVGNIPQNYSTQQLMDTLNGTLREMGARVNVF
jgi:hypothetical protein